MSAFGISAFQNAAAPAASAAYPNQLTMLKLGAGEKVPDELTALYIVASNFTGAAAGITMAYNTAGASGGQGPWRTSLVRTPGGLHAFSSSTSNSVYSHLYLADGDAGWVSKSPVGFGWGYTINGALLPNGTIFFNSTIENSTVSHVYDPSNDTVTQVAASPTRHHYSDTLVLDNGYAVKAGSGYGDLAVEAWNYRTNTWTVLPAMPIYCSAAVALPGNKIMIVDPRTKRVFTLVFGDAAWVEQKGANVPYGWVGMVYESGMIYVSCSDTTLRICDPNSFVWGTLCERKNSFGSGANGGITSDKAGTLYLGLGEGTYTAMSIKIRADGYNIIAASKP